MKKESKRNNAASTAHPSRKRKMADVRSPLSRAARNSVIGFLWTLPVCMLLIFISAFTALKFPDPNSLVSVLAVASLILSFLSCGFISGKLNSSSTFLCSLISGGIMILFIMIVSLFIKGDNTAFSPSQRAILYVSALASSIAGGFLSSLKSKGKRKPKRKNK